MDPSPRKPRFLIAHGERLTKEERYVSSPKPVKGPIYNREEIVAQLGPRLTRSLGTVRDLPQDALPQGRAVVMVTLHPEFLAKSFYPEKLFGSIGLRAVGSRARKVEPKKWSKPAEKSDSPRIAETIDLYMACKVSDLANWEKGMASLAPWVDGMGTIEDIRPLTDLDHEVRVRITPGIRKSGVAEVALHVPQGEDQKVFGAFERYAAEIGIEVYRNLRIEVPGLFFMPVKGDPDALRSLARFSFVRSIALLSACVRCPLHELPVLSVAPSCHLLRHPSIQRSVLLSSTADCPTHTD